MKLLLMFLALTSVYTYATCKKPFVKIAVVDSGFGYRELGHDAKLCKSGHKDFTLEKKFSYTYGTDAPIPYDFIGHGTNIVGLIQKYIDVTDTKYCIIIIKYYSEKQTGHQNTMSTVESFKYANSLGVDYINYSGGGPVENEEEKATIEKFLNRGGKLIASAGNENNDLGIKENGYYPAMYDKRIIVVGSTTIYGVRSKSSNYGIPVNRWEVGELQTAYGITMTGTSQATAVATGKIVAENNNRCDIGF